MDGHNCQCMWKTIRPVCVIYICFVIVLLKEAFYTKGSKGCPAGGYLEEHLRYVRKNMIRKEEVGEHQGRKEEVGKHQGNWPITPPPKKKKKKKKNQ